MADASQTERTVTFATGTRVGLFAVKGDQDDRSGEGRWFLFLEGPNRTTRLEARAIVRAAWRRARRR